MISIRTFLRRRLLIGLALLLVASQLAFYFFVRTRSIAQFDSSLTMTARVVAELTRQTPSQVRLLSSVYELVPDLLRDHGDEYVQIWLADGETLEQSHSLHGHELPRMTGTILAPSTRRFVLADGRPARAVGFRFTPKHSGFSHPLPPRIWEEEAEQTVRYTSPQEVDLVLARGCADLDQSLTTLLMGCLWGSVVILLGIGVLIPKTLDRGLKPLTLLAQQTETIDLGSLSSRYPTENLPSEILPIATQLNQLLERLESGFQREKRLTANMAHELKTPISELQALTQVALKWPGDEEFLLATLRDAFDISRQMKVKVSTLLALAYSESGAQPITPSRVELPDLVREQWSHWNNLAIEKEIDAEFDFAEEIEVVTDESMLSSILTNLFSNAIEYCPSKGRLACRLRDLEKGIRLTLRNTNRTLTADDITHLLDPFWRKDVARTDGNHCGLGLTLVRNYARILGVQVRFQLTSTGDFQVALDIPREIGG